VTQAVGLSIPPSALQSVLEPFLARAITPSTTAAISSAITNLISQKVGSLALAFKVEVFPSPDDPTNVQISIEGDPGDLDYLSQQLSEPASPANPDASFSFGTLFNPPTPGDAAREELRRILTNEGYEAIGALISSRQLISNGRVKICSEADVLTRIIGALESWLTGEFIPQTIIVIAPRYTWPAVIDKLRNIAGTSTYEVREDRVGYDNNRVRVQFVTPGDVPFRLRGTTIDYLVVVDPDAAGIVPFDVSSFSRYVPKSTIQQLKDYRKSFEASELAMLEIEPLQERVA
jgi:hypothetical protein